MILVLGALGQIGLELTQKLRKEYGSQKVIAADIREPSPAVREQGPFFSLDCRSPEGLVSLFQQYPIRQLYHLPALLSSAAEKAPQTAVQTNFMGLYNSLELARQYNCQLFFPSTIGVFSEESPPDRTPQNCVMRPKTIYGTTKLAGELLCDYYHHKYGLDIRGIRFPGIVSHQVIPHGGTTDFAVEIFFAASKANSYVSYLEPQTTLDMVYIDDAIDGILQLMEAPAQNLKTRNAYNITSMQLNAELLGREIALYKPGFKVLCQEDPLRQQIADSWPNSLDDSCARAEWGWNPTYDIKKTVATMIKGVSSIKTSDYV